MAEARLIRFVAAPDGTVAPDLGRKLPGRGLWVACSRASIEAAVKRQAFSRAAKTKLVASADLPDLVESMLARRCLDRLGLARRAGALTSGFESVRAALASGKTAWWIEAHDGASDGRRKLAQAVRALPRPPRLCAMFSSDELGLALGLPHVIHLGLLAGRWAGRFTEEVERLSGFRPFLPERWGGEAFLRGADEGPSPCVDI